MAINKTVILGLLLHFEDDELVNGDMKVNQLSANDIGLWQNLFNSDSKVKPEPISEEAPIETPSEAVPTEPEVVIDIPSEPVGIDSNPEPEVKEEVPAEPTPHVILPVEPEATEPEPDKEVPAEAVIIHEDEDGDYDANQAYEDYLNEHSNAVEPTPPSEEVIVDTVPQPIPAEPAQTEPVADTTTDTEETSSEPSDNVDSIPATPSKETPEPSEVDSTPDEVDSTPSDVDPTPSETSVETEAEPTVEPATVIDQPSEETISDEAIAFVADIEAPSDEELAYIDANLAAANEPKPKATRKRKAKLDDADSTEADNLL